MPAFTTTSFRAKRIIESDPSGEIVAVNVERDLDILRVQIPLGAGFSCEVGFGASSRGAQLDLLRVEICQSSEEEKLWLRVC